MTRSWEDNNKEIGKEYEFRNFKEALDFVNVVGKLAEEANHHPDIRIYDYKKVKLTLTTHNEGKVTEKDWELAKKIDQI